MCLGLAFKVPTFFGAVELSNSLHFLPLLLIGVLFIGKSLTQVFPAQVKPVFLKRSF
jgi:hypothetical protein